MGAPYARSLLHGEVLGSHAEYAEYAEHAEHAQIIGANAPLPASKLSTRDIIELREGRQAKPTTDQVCLQFFVRLA